MAQQNLAFITGHTRGGGLEAALIDQIERFVQLGRKNVVVVMDTFPSLEGKTMAALQLLLRRASELDARVTCVALDDRIVHLLRAMLADDDVRIIRRVDQIPGAAA